MQISLGRVDISIGRPQLCNFTLINASWFITGECVQFEVALCGFVLTVEYWRRKEKSDGKA